MPFATGSRRSARGFRTGFALALIVIYHEIIQQGGNVANKGDASPLLTLWLPCALLALFAAWRYAAVCFTIGHDPVGIVIDRAGDVISGWRAALMRRLGWGQPA